MAPSRAASAGSATSRSIACAQRDGVARWDVQAVLAVDHDVGLAPRAGAHHGLAHRHRLEDRRDPRLEVGVLERHHHERGVGVQLAQLEQVEPRTVTLAGTSRPAELSWCFDHGLAAAMTTSTSSGADGVDEGRVVTALLPDGAEQRATRSAGVTASGRQNPVSTMKWDSTTCSRRYPSSLDGEAGLLAGVDDERVDPVLQAQDSVQQRLLPRREDVADHHVARAAPHQARQRGIRDADLLAVGEDDAVAPCAPRKHAHASGHVGAEPGEQWREDVRRRPRRRLVEQVGIERRRPSRGSRCAAADRRRSGPGGRRGSCPTP